MTETHRHGAARKACRCEVCNLETVVASVRRYTQLVAESPAMQALLVRVRDFAEADAPVVVFGESGTGKEIVVRALHANSPRRERPFVALNVAAVPGELLESELFGHLRGAFTGATADRQGLLASADGGTLFLDEIAEMPLPLQAKLLRVVQDGEVRRVGDTKVFAVDVRFIGATHRDLRARVTQGLFREDLYYRLKVLSLQVPALRDRREDILPLAEVLLAEERRPAKAISAEARALLLGYAWPGNVRELASAIKHGCALARGGELRPEHLPDELRRPGGSQRSAPVELQPLAELERAHILAVLERCGSPADAARVLGIGRTTLWRKLRQYGIAPGR